MNTEASDRVAPRFDRKKVCFYEWVFDFYVFIDRLSPHPTSVSAHSQTRSRFV